MDENFKLALEKQNPWWFDKRFDFGISRQVYLGKIARYINTPELILLVGARRTGKSTILFQVIDNLLKKVSADSILFINLDEPVFQDRVDDPSFLGNLLEGCLLEKPIKYIFIDEIQNYEFWAQTVKMIYDLKKGVKLFLTGSSSTLIHGKLATRLAGRFFHIKVFPLSFVEFLEFRKTTKLSKLQKRKAFENYLKFGSFPRVVLEGDEFVKNELLKNYFQTIYLKDIIYPHNLRNNKDVFDLLYFILSNVGKPFSFNKIARVLDVSVDTVKDYVGYAMESYLVFSISKYDLSVKKQIMNPKKLYCLDSGLVNSVSFSFSENRGRLLENLVFISLLRGDCDIFYHKGNFECDFLLKQARKIVSAIQVTVSIKDLDVRQREIKGLLEALQTHNLKQGLILTENESEIIKVEGRTIFVKPIFEWLFEI